MKEVKKERRKDRRKKREGGEEWKEVKGWCVRCPC